MLTALQKLVAPAVLRAVVSYVEVKYQMSERLACGLMGLGRSTHRYRAQKAGGGQRTANPLERGGGSAHEVWLSATDGDAAARRDAGQSQTGVPVVPRERFGDEDSATAADPLEWRSH